MSKITPNDIVQRLEHLRSQRAPWHGMWTKISDYVMPNRGDFPNDPNSFTVGESRTEKIYDGTAIWANEQFASGMMGFVINPAERWFGLSTGDQDLDKEDEVRTWLEHATDVLYSVFNSPLSNFISQAHEAWLDLGGFGTANTLIEERTTGFPIRYTTFPLAECYIAEGPDGMVDTLYRVYSRTAKQLAEKYGDKVQLPEPVLKALEKEPKRRFTVCHAIQPRFMFDATKQDSMNMPWGSWVVLTDFPQLFLEQTGYREFPCASSRWVLVSGEEYGRSPAMNCIPDIEMVNTMQKTVLRGAQKIVDPPLQMPDEGFLMPVKMNPAALNFYDAGGLGKEERIMPILTGGNPGIGLDMITNRHEHILRCFYVDLMQMMKNVEMTATEVLQRREDRMRLAAPMVARHQHEYLDKIISRTLNICMRRGMIQPAPEAIEGVDVQYVNQVARAQKATRLFEFQRFLESMAATAQFKPEVLDRLDGDGAFKFAHQLLDAPMSILVNDDEVARIRADRQRQANSTMQAENLGKLAPYLKAVNEQESK